MNRLFLTKLVLRGENLKDAILTFTIGFNAITGASDTGKTFAYNSINYALGADKIPPIPPEADGYDRVFVEIDNGNDQKYTVMRSFLKSEKNKIFIFNSEIDNLSIDVYSEYSTGPRAKNRYTDFLMNIFDCTYKTVLVADGEDCKSFTFRFFAHLIMLSETKVYAVHSPVYESDSNSDVIRPSALSAFHILLKGEDQPAPPKQEKFVISQARTMGKKEQLEKLCLDLDKEVIGLKSMLGGWEYVDIEHEINRIERNVAAQRTELEKYQDDLSLKEQSMLELKEKRIRIHDTILRMELLKKNYESDSERIQFIDETNIISEQFINVQCPICNSILPSPSTDKQKLKFDKAILAEKNKLIKQIADLSEAIDDFSSDEEKIAFLISSAEEAIESTQKAIDGLLSNGINEALRELDRYRSSRDVYIDILNKEKVLLEYRQLIEDLKKEIENMKKRRSRSQPSAFISYTDELGEFCSYVSSYFSKWGFSDERVSFNQVESDLIIGTKDKRSFGQGKRAIINSAFVLGLLDYSIAKHFAYPGFVMIDSPLTTYKDKDNSEDDVTTSVKQSFYSNLSTISKDRQIIIFDNEEPSEKATGAIYHHFSGNPAIGRAGFIPPKDHDLPFRRSNNRIIVTPVFKPIALCLHPMQSADRRRRKIL